MGICFCCLNEGQKVSRVLDKFPAMGASQSAHVQPGALVKIVGRCTLAGTNPFYAPASGKPCVYYKVTVHEERERIDRDSDGNTRRTKHWVLIDSDERQVDFYLQDGATRVFVKGSARSETRIQGENDGGGHSGHWSSPPPGIRSLIGHRYRRRGGGNFDWDHRPQATGRYKYTERKFEVNELVAALGVIQHGTDPYGQAVGILSPFTESTLTKEWFDAEKWSDWDQRSWHSLLSQGQAVLLSDDTKFTNNVNVAPINVPIPVAVPTYNWDQQWTYSGDQNNGPLAIANPVH